MSRNDSDVCTAYRGARCSCEGHKKDKCTSNEVKCFHCGEDHHSYSRNCPVFKKEMEIVQIHTKERIPRQHAIRKLLRVNSNWVNNFVKLFVFKHVFALGEVFFCNHNKNVRKGNFFKLFWNIFGNIKILRIKKVFIWNLYLGEKMAKLFFLNWVLEQDKVVNQKMRKNEFSSLVWVKLKKSLMYKKNWKTNVWSLDLGKKKFSKNVCSCNRK